MEKIPSFQVNHLNLLCGAYVSRRDFVGQSVVTTFDIRMTRPNNEPVMSTGTIHAIEHIGATFLRNHKEYSGRTIYFGPMGCRTGFYLIMEGDLFPKDIKQLLDDTMKYIAEFEGEIPGASPKDCGNYSDMDLEGAKKYAQKYIDEVLSDFSEKRTVYPD